MAAKTVTFESKFGAYNLVRRPKVQVPAPTGVGYITTEKGKDYQFQPVPSPHGAEGTGFVGVLTVKVGQDRMLDIEDGWLRPGEDPEKERDVVEALMAHREFGQDFWVQGFPPGTQLPRPQDIEKEIMRAVATLDDAKLAERLEEERRTHARVDVLAKVEEALALVREERASLAAQAEATAEESEVEPVAEEPEPEPVAKAKPKPAAKA